MDINPSSIRKPNQINVWSSNDNSEGAEQTRSFTCAFCKRGFSNAQALGGHMNIHRRDRARLRQASEELSLDLGTSAAGLIDHDPPDKASEDKISPKTASSDVACSTPKRDTIDASQRGIGKFVDEGVLPIHLSLDLKVGDVSSTSTFGNEDKKKQSVKRSSQEELVDLELRLGPEPHETSRKNTREFF